MKIICKINLFKMVLPILVMIFVLSTSIQMVKAAGGIVETVSTTVSGTTVTVSGTVNASPVVYAVAIAVYDSNGNLNTMFTTNVDAANTYQATFTLPEGTYLIKVADYEGGTFVESTVSVSATAATAVATVPTDSKTPVASSAGATATSYVANAPKTGDDTNMFVWILIAVAGLGCTTLGVKNLKRSKEA